MRNSKRRMQNEKNEFGIIGYSAPELEIVKLETSSTATAAQMTGTVKTVNATYGLVVIESGGREYNIFTNSNTKIINSKTGDGMKLKNLEKDSPVAITGSNTSGVYEATVIVVQ